MDKISMTVERWVNFPVSCSLKGLSIIILDSGIWGGVIKELSWMDGE